MDNSHTKPQAVVLEGKYWRRRLEAVATEYRKFRVWYLNSKMKQAEQNTPGVMDVSSLPPTVEAQQGGLWQGLTDTFVPTPQEAYSQGMGESFS
jgi:hypothetical protein